PTTKTCAPAVAAARQQRAKTVGVRNVRGPMASPLDEEILRLLGILLQEPNVFPLQQDCFLQPHLGVARYSWSDSPRKCCSITGIVLASLGVVAKICTNTGFAAAACSIFVCSAGG